MNLTAVNNLNVATSRHCLLPKMQATDGTIAHRCQRHRCAAGTCDAGDRQRGRSFPARRMQRGQTWQAAHHQIAAMAQAPLAKCFALHQYTEILQHDLREGHHQTPKLGQSWEPR